MNNSHQWRHDYKPDEIVEYFKAVARSAINYFESHAWVRFGHMAYDKDGNIVLPTDKTTTSLSLAGSLFKAGLEVENYYRLDSFCFIETGMSLVDFNDCPGRKAEEIIAFLELLAK